MRLHRPHAGFFGGSCNFSRGATATAVIACIFATILCIVGGVYIYGERFSDISIHDGVGLSKIFDSHLGFSCASKKSKEPKDGEKGCEQIECPPPLFLRDNATIPIPLLESLPLLNIEEMWGDFSRWGNFTMKRFWDEDTLKNALRASDPVQLYPLIKKLERGEPIIVVALGSSVTQEFGGVYHRDLEMIYKQVPMPTHGAYLQNYDPAMTAPTAPRHRGWLELFMQYVNHTWPHPDHLLINSGSAARVPAVFADGSCLEYSLPRQADLVILETMGTGDPQGLERLSWRVLRHFKEQQQVERPAVLYFNPVYVQKSLVQGQHTVPWGGFCGPPDIDLTECCKNYTEGAVEASFTDRGNHFGNDGQHHELAKLYGFGSISHRDFLLPYIRAKAWEWLTPEFGECGFTVLMNHDHIHPTPLGRFLFADLVWTYLSVGKVAYAQRHAAHALKTSPEGENTSISELSGAERVDARWREAKLTLIDSLSGATTTLPLPELPFSPEGRNVFFTRCYGFLQNFALPRTSDSELKGTTLELRIISAQGFEFHENTTHGTVVKRKPGWIALEVGSFMEVEVDTLFDGNETPTPTDIQENSDNSASENDKPTGPDVVVTFLKSYEHMGRATVTCVSGCSCDVSEIEAHHDDKTSISGLHAFPVTQSKNCRFKIQVLEGTSSGEHKFKVTQVTTRIRIQD
jgi:hypothetical protein